MSNYFSLPMNIFDHLSTLLCHSTMLIRKTASLKRIYIYSTTKRNLWECVPLMLMLLMLECTSTNTIASCCRRRRRRHDQLTIYSFVKQDWRGFYLPVSFLWSSIMQLLTDLIYIVLERVICKLVLFFLCVCVYNFPLFDFYIVVVYLCAHWFCVSQSQQQQFLQRCQVLVLVIRKWNFELEQYVFLQVKVWYLKKNNVCNGGDWMAFVRSYRRRCWIVRFNPFKFDSN